MISMSILFVISFTLNIILALKLKNSKTITKELTLKVKILSDYADDTVKVKNHETRGQAIGKPAKAVVKWTKQESVVEYNTSTTAKESSTEAAPKNYRKTRRKKKPNTPKN